MNKKKPIKTPDSCLEKIMRSVKGIDTPAKRQQESVRQIVKYFVIEYYPGKYPDFENNFNSIHQSVLESFSDAEQEERISAPLKIDVIDTAKYRSAMIPNGLIYDIVYITDKFIKGLSESGPSDKKTIHKKLDFLAKTLIKHENKPTLIIQIKKTILASIEK